MKTRVNPETQAPEGWIPGKVNHRFVTAPKSASKTYDAEKRTVEAVLATGYRVKRWFGFEELSITEDAVDQSRVAMGQVKVLDHHNAYERDAVLGTVIETRIEGTRLVGVIKFGDNEIGRAAEKDAASGDLGGISVGYRISKIVLAESSDEADVYRAERWELLEVSIVSVPADPFAAVRHAHIGDRPMEKTETENRAEAEAEAARKTAADKLAAEKATAERAAADKLAADEARTSERVRIAEIQSIARAHKIDDTVVAKAVEGGTTTVDFRAIALDVLHARSVAEGTGANARSGVLDERTSRIEGMTAALTARLAQAAGEKVDIDPKGRQWSGLGIVEMAAESIAYNGPLRMASHVQNVMERAMMGTSDFPIILGAALNARLLSRYSVISPTYRAFAGRYVNPDFRDANVIRAGDWPELKELNEHGEIESGSFSESAEKFRVKSYARMMNITRQAIINDNLNAFEQVLGSAADRVADWENKMVFDALLSNAGAGPTLYGDSKAVFHTDHGNLAAVANIVSVDSLDVGYQAMAAQTTLDGMTTSAFNPVVLLCGPKRRVQAERLLATINPTKTDDVVPGSMRTWRVVVDPRITDYAWYLFADPASAPCILYGYLQGFEAPRMSSEQFFTMQGMRVKLEHDFGTGAADYRGAFKNAGAATAPT